MSAPRRVQLSRRKGYRMAINTVHVGRPSKWGNPFVVGVFGTRLECVQTFRILLAGHLCCTGAPSMTEQQAFMKFANANIHRLRGKDLACWCPLPKNGQPDICHGAVLIALANGTPLNMPEIQITRIT